jgi:acetyltransferase-like isoleucine patch superfamily enzyme
MILRRLVRRLIIKLAILVQDANYAVARATLPKFGNTPQDVEIALPRTIMNPERIFLGEGVRLGPGTSLMAIKSYPSLWMQHPEGKQIQQQFEPKITIGNRVTATANLQIGAHHEVIIEDDVLLASNIHMTDGLHSYEHAHEPYKYQGIFKIAPIVIKRGCWIGQNVVILPGVTIGEYSIIGANSVVTKSVPAKCIAVGAPAKVIRKWHETTQSWISPVETAI